MTVATHSFRAFFVTIALCFAISPAANAATVTVDFRGDGPYDKISRTGVPFNLGYNGPIPVFADDSPSLGNHFVPVTQSALGLGAWGIDFTPDDTRKVETRVDLGESLRFDFFGPGPRPLYPGVRDIVIDFGLTNVTGFDPYNTDLLTVRAAGAGGGLVEQTFKFGSFFLSLKLPDIFNTEDTISLELISTERSAFIVESITFTTVPVPAGLLLSASSLLVLAPFALSRHRRRNTKKEAAGIS